MFVLVSLKILSTIIYPLLLVVFSLNGLKDILNSNLLLKIKLPIKKSAFIIVPFYAFYAVFSLLNTTIIGVLLSVLFFSAAVIYPVNIILRSKKAGIYREGLIIPNGQYKWKEIEGFIVLEKSIRFIHKDTGAFDVNIDGTLLKEAEKVINDLGIRIIDNKS